MNTSSRTRSIWFATPLVIFLLSPSLAWTTVEWDSSRLMMKNAEQVNDLINNKIKKAQAIQAKQPYAEEGIKADPAAVQYLEDAMRILLARPDQDGTRAVAFSRLRRELVDLAAFDQVLKDLSREGIDGLKDTNSPVSRQATYIMILENLMAELKPEVSDSAVFKKIIEDISNAKIEISDKVKIQQLLRAMSKPVSPSETAAKILESAGKKEDSKKKK